VVLPIWSGRTHFWEESFLAYARFDEGIYKVFLGGVEGEVALVWDRSGSHRAMATEMPGGIIPIFLPRASPELNPVESVWRALRKKLANRVFETLEGLEEAVTEALREYWEKPEVLISMTAYSWWREAVKSRHG